jgi:hypothetical protein
LGLDVHNVLAGMGRFQLHCDDSEAVCRMTPRFGGAMTLLTLELWHRLYVDNSVTVFKVPAGGWRPQTNWTA